jgi:hypothetical protein
MALHGKELKIAMFGNCIDALVTAAHTERSARVCVTISRFERREKVKNRKTPLRGDRCPLALAAALGVVGLTGALAARADLNGFSNFTLNGGATTDGTTLTITDGAQSEARSAFNNAIQNVTSFTTTFTYTDVGGGGADGFAFVVHNDPRGVAALGDSGGAIGYAGTDVTRIQPSAADSFNIYTGNGGISGSGYRTNGNKEIGATTPVDVASGHPILVTLRYSGGPTLTETLTDTVANTTSFKAYSANIPSAVGASTAYVGFTGGTGGATATQTISNFTFSNVTAVARASTPLAVSGFNQDVVVEAGATNDATNHYLGAVTSTLDGSTAKTGATFYEKGLPGTVGGLPAGGASFVSQDDPNTTLALQSATGNNSLELNKTNPTGTLTLASPKALSQLVVLATTGSGSYLSAPMTLHFSDGRADLLLAYSAPDWFGRDGAALLGVDRIDAGAGKPDNNTGDPRLYETSLDLTQFGVENSPISSISFDFGGGTTGNGNTEIFAVSGAATPEPASFGLVLIGGMGYLARRRRSR